MTTRASELAADPDALREAVRARYAAAATAVTRPVPTRAEDAVPMLATDGCCSGTTSDSGACRASSSDSAGCCASSDRSVVTSELYRIDEVSDLPPNAVLASLGCGNPTALAELRQGHVVLDLGSGGGIDVLLSARRVGPTGFAFGLDMTDEMLALAERNRAEAGVSNVRFLKGEMEHIPLPDSSVDVIISNCVINLSADKSQVLHEAARVLRPGGRFAVSDVVVQGELLAEVRTSMEQWVGCVAGALEEDSYRRLLSEAGFEDVGIEVTRVFDPTAASASEKTAGAAHVAKTPEGRLVSAFVRATKPSRTAPPR
jgi:ubiquinone/menaquinone biosynthesis C-methylase UbiE